MSRSFCPHRLDCTRDAERFETVHNKASGRKLSLNYLHYGAEVEVEPGELDNFYLIQFPLRGRALVTNGRHEVDSHEQRAAIINPSLWSRLVWQAGCEKLIVQIDRDALNGLAEGLIGHRLERPVVFSPAIDCKRPEIVEWMRLVRSCLTVAEHEPAHWGLNNRYQEVVEEDLMARFLMCQPSVIYHFLKDRTPSAATTRQLRRARGFMHANLAEPITLSQISEAAGCSIRSLQLAFRDRFNCSPMQYMRDERLRMAHYLLQTEPAGSLVSQIAYDVGFSHLGRFAVAYRKMFGQSPSTTLPRS